MDSDSDRTIDSDELEEIIRQSQKKKSSDAGLSDKSKKVQRRPSFHDLSDTDSDVEILEEKQKRTKLKTNTGRPKCEYGKNCYRKNPDHIKNFDHGSDDAESNTLCIKSRKKNKYDTENSKDRIKIKSKHYEISSQTSESETPIKKRKENNDASASNARPKCPFGKECYRKNPDHIKEFYHKDEQSEDSNEEQTNSVNHQKSPAIKCHNFQFYLTKVTGIHHKYNMLALDIKDILTFKDGSLIKSAQFNYMFDIEWLMQQYPEKYRSCPLTIVHGEQRESKKSLEKSGARFPNISFCQAKLDIPFGTHHTKMMFLLYKEGFRVVIHTSNIVDSDWFQRTQGMWVSPVLPALQTPSTTDGNPPTNFKSDLLEYVSSYGAPSLDEWLQVIKRHDFSKVKVVLIGSVPGRHVGSKKTSFGHLKLKKVLNLHGSPKEAVKSDWPVICQFSSIGSLGASPDQWLRGEFCASLSTIQNAPLSQSACLKLVFPTVENVRKSLQGYPAGASLPYSIKVAQKQPYLKEFLHANLSKAAWGALEKKGTQFMIRSYELGVLFLPKFFEVEFFSIPGNVTTDFNKLFPVPYDIPLEPYSKNDEPWIWDIPHIKAPDRNGMKWCPP
ncbi:tyrosyl-DNA phosphodiesterase 1 [Nephila pilipes]|uniref:Tyrosyl-DNA phosphodiesterase 1 n=1 Tax=Nephila pilipes TaxID=299642 RepID=A0A8X6MQ88_NEPPI|nr:tyrosyl-DNA phosphodiesterase 1 [Nephila pilipes]